MITTSTASTIPTMVPLVESAWNAGAPNHDPEGLLLGASLP